MEKDALKAVLKEVLEEHHTAFYVKAEKHYQHHKLMDSCQKSRKEWKKNHELISSVRKTGERIKETSVKTTTGVLIASFLGCIWYAIKYYFKGAG